MNPPQTPEDHDRMTRQLVLLVAFTFLMAALLVLAATYPKKAVIFVGLSCLLSLAFSKAADRLRA